MSSRLSATGAVLVIWAIMSGPAAAACSTAQTIGKICKAGADLAAELAGDMPVDLDTLSLLVPVGTIHGAMIIGQPTVGGAPPNPADAAEYLCGNAAARVFIAAGGTIDVLLNDRPFLKLSDCEAL